MGGHTHPGPQLTVWICTWSSVRPAPLICVAKWPSACRPNTFADRFLAVALPFVQLLFITNSFVVCLPQSHLSNRFPQERIPKANSRSAHPQGHLQPLCVLHQLLSEKHLLCAVWQREHRNIPSGNGQAGGQMKIAGLCVCVCVCLGAIF